MFNWINLNKKLINPTNGHSVAKFERYSQFSYTSSMQKQKKVFADVMINRKNLALVGSKRYKKIRTASREKESSWAQKITRSLGKANLNQKRDWMAWRQLAERKILEREREARHSDNDEIFSAFQLLEVTLKRKKNRENLLMNFPKFHQNSKFSIFFPKTQAPARRVFFWKTPPNRMKSAPTLGKNEKLNIVQWIALLYKWQKHVN